MNQLQLNSGQTNADGEDNKFNVVVGKISLQIFKNISRMSYKQQQICNEVNNNIENTINIIFSNIIQQNIINTAFNASLVQLQTQIDRLSGCCTQPPSQTPAQQCKAQIIRDGFQGAALNSMMGQCAAIQKCCFLQVTNDYACYESRQGSFGYWQYSIQQCGTFING
ncbi:Hypothetical_protein [Hexamita inflata]|uniref:Hypothetical_protein n=1 Tax=Hexamita inflata TaxID=28002 RepID=A0ABP1LVI0_9EUKA